MSSLKTIQTRTRKTQPQTVIEAPKSAKKSPTRKSPTRTTKKSPTRTTRKSPTKRSPTRKSPTRTSKKSPIKRSPTRKPEPKRSPNRDHSVEEWVKSPVTGRWIRVGGQIYKQLQAEHNSYFENAETRKGNLYGEHGCSNANKYVGQPGPFCGPKRCGGHTYPVRSEAEYRAAISYARFADPQDQEGILACAARVRANGFKSGGNDE